MVTLRPSQQQALEYSGGRLGIAAVPGSGKTFTLELLILELISRRGVSPDRIGVFTYMRSARANLIRRINQRLRDQGILHRFGGAFTLHALALRILRTYQSRLQGEEVLVLEQYEQDRLIQHLSRTWLKHNTKLWHPLLPEEESPFRRRGHHLRFSNNFERMCAGVIRTSKTYRLPPEQITAASGGFLSWALPVYQLYQQRLQELGKLDYDDLGWRALDLLNHDEEVRTDVQGWYDYLFEDEAQDSSPLQDEMLQIMSARHGNLVRVGDPNQSIMGTFTTADPSLFRAYCAHSQSIALDESSRSAPMILSLANQLVDWVNRENPLLELRQALAPQHIQPASSGPANPPDEEAEIQFLRVSGSPDHELEVITRSALTAVKLRPHHAVAILVPTNELGAKALRLLQDSDPQALLVDLLRSNPSQKIVLQRLLTVTQYLAQPTSAKRLGEVITTLYDWAEIPTAEVRQRLLDWVTESLPEQVLFPFLSRADPVKLGFTSEQWTAIQGLLQQLAAWIRAARSPWSDLLYLIAQEIYSNPEDLFTCHYAIHQLEQELGDQPLVDWGDISSQLQTIVEGQLNNLPSDISAYIAVPGSITVTTLHRSKGLEWDEILITGVSAYEYPVIPQDHPMGLRFMDNTDMAAEAIAELRSQVDRVRQVGTATEQAFLDLAAERLRLLYVGITRAKRRLTLSVATETPFESEQAPSTVYRVLQSWVKQKTHP